MAKIFVLLMAILAFSTPAFAQVTSISTTFPGLHVTNPTTTPILDQASGLTPHMVLGTFAGSTVTLGSLTVNDLPVLTSGHLFIGNSSNIPTDTAISGDATLSNTGVLTLKNTGPGAESATNANVTIDAQGRITALSSGTPGTGFGGDGSGGALTNPSLSSSVPTILNASSLTVSSSLATASGTVLNSSSTFSMTAGGITVSTINNQAGGSITLQLGHAGSGVSPGYPPTTYGNGGGGGGGSTLGGNGGLSTTGQDINGGNACSISQATLAGSSGAAVGGSGAGVGGAGGGGLRICAVGAINMSGGTINVSGGNAQNSGTTAAGSGGGAGGTIAIYSQTSITGTGSTLRSDGGFGGNAGGTGNAGGGGSGAPGFIVQMAPVITTGTIDLSAPGGGSASGTGTGGGNATSGAVISIVAKPTLPLIVLTEKRRGALFALGGARQWLANSERKELHFTQKEDVSLVAAIEDPEHFEGLCFDLNNGEEQKGAGKVCRVDIGDSIEARKDAA